jgi:hypothetical protein
MVESLYQEYRSTHPERFTIGRGRKAYTDLAGRGEKHPCFGCIVDSSLSKACVSCNKTEIKKAPKQATLKF